MNKNRTLCFSGYRTERLPKNKKKFTYLLQNVFMEIDKAISEGYYTFLFGACYGFDLICAEQILLRKQIIQFSNPVHMLIARSFCQKLQIKNAHYCNYILYNVV